MRGALVSGPGNPTLKSRGVSGTQTVVRLHSRSLLYEKPTLATYDTPLATKLYYAKLNEVYKHIFLEKYSLRYKHYGVYMYGSIQ